MRVILKTRIPSDVARRMVEYASIKARGTQIVCHMSGNTALLEPMLPSGLGCQSMILNIVSGLVTIRFQGDRNDTDWLSPVLSPEFKRVYGNITRFEIVSIKTTHSTWCVKVPFLEGQIGNGPSSISEEAMLIDDALHMNRVRKLASITGYKLPTTLQRKGGKWYIDGRVSEFKVSLLGHHYRRASAQGYRL
jgi:hypothetical protein